MINLKWRSKEESFNWILFDNDFWTTTHSSGENESTWAPIHCDFNDHSSSDDSESSLGGLKKADKSIFEPTPFWSIEYCQHCMISLIARAPPGDSSHGSSDPLGVDGCELTNTPAKSSATCAIFRSSAKQMRHLNLLAQIKYQNNSAQHLPHYNSAAQ